MSYIEREAVCYQLAKQATIDGQPRAIKRAAKIVEDFPAADVRPNLRGKWERFEDDFGKYDRCSNCGKEYAFGPIVAMHYCPNCGADMRGESDA